ncbi:MAG: hypothetical protein V3V06_02560 [Dehalococcoidia bacterium]
MNTLQILGVVLIIFSGLWMTGMLPKTGLLRFYRRIRLLGLLWAAAIVLIAAARVFDFI